MDQLSEPLERAKVLWQRSDEEPKRCLQEARSLCDEYRFTKHHAAYAWGALTCGKLKLFDHELPASEAYLAEAIGRFEYLDDEVGAALASALLGAAASMAGCDRDIDLVSRPLKLIESYSENDQALIHTLVASCHWRR